MAHPVMVADRGAAGATPVRVLLGLASHNSTVAIGALGVSNCVHAARMTALATDSVNHLLASFAPVCSSVAECNGMQRNHGGF
jgi:hypothetical protein